MFRLFEGQTADDVWQTIASTFRCDDGAVVQPSRAGLTREILHAAISIADPLQRWVVSRSPAINPAFAIAEIVWIVTGRNDSAFLNYFNRELPKYAGQGATYHGAYGYRLRHHLGLDQLDRAFLTLRGKPHSRQVVLQIWDGKIDFPGFNGEESAPDIPCNIMSMLKVRDGKLEWTQILRSSDIHRGLPYDFVQFMTLQEIIAGWLGISLGSYNQISDSLHVYEDCNGHLNASVPVTATINTDSLMLPRSESEDAFRMLGKQAEMIADKEVSVVQLLDLVRQSQLPQAFRNMLCVLCAEGGRRRKCHEAVHELMSLCTNPVYCQIYDAWLRRF